MDVWHSHLDYCKNCSVHPQDMSSTYLSGFGHTSPLSRNGFPYVASVHQASSRTHRVSVFLFQYDRLFSAQMCASCSGICAHIQKALNRTGLPVLPDCCNHTAFPSEPHQWSIFLYAPSRSSAWFPGDYCTPDNHPFPDIRLKNHQGLKWISKFHRPMGWWNLLSHSRYLLFHTIMLCLWLLLTAVEEESLWVNIYQETRSTLL